MKSISFKIPLILLIPHCFINLSSFLIANSSYFLPWKALPVFLNFWPSLTSKNFELAVLRIPTKLTVLDVIMSMNCCCMLLDGLVFDAVSQA